MGISKRRARAGEGGWPSLGLSSFAYIGPQEKFKNGVKGV